MSDRNLRWGILGAARIAREFVCPGIHASSGGSVAAVASRDLGRAEALTEPYGARAIQGYEALLGDPEIDAIYIPLANSDHIPWTKRCIEAGKPVLCEKPIALEASEIDDLIALRDASGVFVAEAFMVTHHPQWHRARALLRDGAIGQLRAVQGAFSFFNEDPANIRNQAELGGGALRDIGVYPCVSTRFVTGAEPVSVVAQIDWDMGVDGTARVLAAFEGFDLEFYVSMRMGPRQVMTFHGTEGWMSLHAPFNAGTYGDPVIEIRDADGMRHIERFPGTDHYALQAEAFRATLLDGAPFDCPLEFSRGNQAMIDMIYAAAGPA